MSRKSALHRVSSPWRVPARLLSVLVLLSLLLSGQGAAPARAASTLYASPTGSSTTNCLNWGAACTLQRAITLAGSGDQIWVKRGTYTPTVRSSPSVARTETFSLKDGVSIYGGFFGNETLLSARNPALYPSILSGDLQNTPGVSTDNSFHVVRAGAGITASTVLDGFTITGGYAWDGVTILSAAQIDPLAIDDEWSGGGMFIHSGSTSLSSPTLSNLIFSGNTGYRDGGLAADWSNSTLTNVTFTGNFARTDGGGLGSFNSSLTLTNVTVSGNSALGDAGGMNNGSNSSPTLTNVTFSGNSAASGGAMSGNDPVIYDSIFWGDSPSEFANLSGALIYDSVVSGGCPSGAACVNVINSDPLLGPIADNGGFTMTMAVGALSPAINTGGAFSTCAVVDQRNVTRPQGAACDIGAYEYFTVTITGSAGVAGATMSYVDGTPKTATSGAGPTFTYTITVPAGWSGTVTPSKLAYSFAPVSLPYTGSQTMANLTGQDYVATGTNTEVYVHGSLIGSYTVNSGGQVHPNYPGIFDGAVRVLSTDATNIFASERQIYGASFSESMGIPANRLTTEYFFPWYDGMTMHTWITIGAPSSNVGNASVQVYIGTSGVPVGTYNVAPGGQVHPDYPGVFDGAVRVVCPACGANRIFASERQIFGSSFSETMGIPSNHLDSDYWFPLYDALTMRTWISIGAPSTNAFTASVQVYIAGTLMGTYPVAPGAFANPIYLGAYDGPVRVLSTGGDDIFVSERQIYGSSFSESLGVPFSELATSYYFPWYDGMTMSTALSFGTPSTNIGSATVNVYVAGVLKSSFSMAPGSRATTSYAGLFNGPVLVSSTKNIVVSERQIYGGSFAQTIAIPATQLYTDYWFPWYDGLTMTTWVSIGKP